MSLSHTQKGESDLVEEKKDIPSLVFHYTFLSGAFVLTASTYCLVVETKYCCAMVKPNKPER